MPTNAAESFSGRALSESRSDDLQSREYFLCQANALSCRMMIAAIFTITSFDIANVQNQHGDYLCRMLCIHFAENISQ